MPPWLKTMNTSQFGNFFGNFGKVLTIQADVNCDTNVKHMVDSTIKHFGQLDILVSFHHFNTCTMMVHKLCNVWLP